MTKKHFIFNKSLRLLLIVFLIFPALSAKALTAAEIFEKGKSKLESAKTLSADFKMSYGNGTVSGKLYSKGSKFAIISKNLSNWYNGTDLYTYNASQGETTIFNPSQSELSEINPLLYLNSSSGYNILGSKESKDGVETIMLVPKTKTSSVKSVKIDLDSKNFLPKAIKIVTSSGSKVDITISNIKLDSDISDNTFNYPKSSYPNIPVTDMR